MKKKINYHKKKKNNTLIIYNLMNDMFYTDLLRIYYSII